MIGTRKGFLLAGVAAVALLFAVPTVTHAQCYSYYTPYYSYYTPSYGSYYTYYPGYSYGWYAPRYYSYGSYYPYSTYYHGPRVGVRVAPHWSGWWR